MHNNYTIWIYEMNNKFENCHITSAAYGYGKSQHL